MHETRRRHYRVSISESDPIAVTLTTDAGESARGSLIDITAAGAGARFVAHHTPRLAIGDRVTLTLSSARIAEPITLPATIRSRVDMQSVHRYGFEFDFGEKEPGLPPVLRWLFNRRAAYRVRPTTREPVFARVSAPGATVPPPPLTAAAAATGSGPPLHHGTSAETGTRRPQAIPDGAGRDAAPDGGLAAPADAHHPESLAPIKDISVRGAAVLVTPELDAVIACEETVEISFYLPGSDVLQRLHCSVRRRAPAGDRVLYGLEFDPERSPHFEKQQHALGHYVMQRQREERPLEHGLD